jgi:hypothetical protein
MSHEPGDLPDPDPRLATAPARRLLDLVLALATPFGHEVEFRGAERQAWRLADRAVRADLEALVRAIDETPALDGDALADAISALMRRVPDAEADVALATLVQALEDDIGEREVHTRFLGRGRIDGSLDWPHARAVLYAWLVSLEYTDGDGDEEFLPQEAEPLVELWEERPRPTAAPAVVKANGPARPYDPRTHYVVGDAIAHGLFGEGVVIAPGDATVTVRFSSGEKKLAHAPAPAADLRAKIAAELAARDAAQGARGPRNSKEAVGVVVKRLPPDPRLVQRDAPEQFSHLAREELEPPDDD